MTEPIDTAVIRENLQMIGAAALPTYWRWSVLDMADEIDRLRAEVVILRSVVSVAASTWETVEIEHADD